MGVHGNIYFIRKTARYFDMCHGGVWCKAAELEKVVFDVLTVCFPLAGFHANEREDFFKT